MSAQDVFVIVHCPSPPYFVEGGDFRDSVNGATSDLAPLRINHESTKNM